ncbi:MAG: hypothetical protein K9M81_06265 [Chthoniobacterales bacterium]|nr:hypothetical protein [Chthoniobacterales bacterium]
MSLSNHQKNMEELTRIFHTNLLRKPGSQMDTALISNCDWSGVYSYSPALQSFARLVLISFARRLMTLQSEIFMLSLFFLLVATPLHADSVKRNPVLLIEPSFYHHPISTLIPGARKTVITAAWMDRSQETSFKFLEPSWKTTKRSFMNRFVQEARQTLSEQLSSIHPHLLRDEHQVIQVAMIESEHPLTASTILAPEFGQQFVMIFGPEMLIAIPSANRIYIFSKLASSIEEIAPAIRDDYKLAINPVSLEIFELDFKHGQGDLHTVGSLESL